MCQVAIQRIFVIAFLLSCALFVSAVARSNEFEMHASLAGMLFVEFFLNWSLAIEHCECAICRFYMVEVLVTAMSMTYLAFAAFVIKREGNYVESTTALLLAISANILLTRN